MTFDHSPFMLQSWSRTSMVSKHRRNLTEEVNVQLMQSAAIENTPKLLSASIARPEMFNNAKIRERNRSLSQYSASLVEDHLLYKPIYKLNIDQAYT